MSFWSDFRDVVKIVVAAYIAYQTAGTSQWLSGASLLFAATSDVYARGQRRKAEKQARQDFLNSLKDRYQMVRGGTEPRKVVYGRARISGPIVYAQSTGTKKEFLHLVVALAGHECDAIETVLFNDVALPAEDGSGFIQSGEYASSVLTTVTDFFSGTSKVLAFTPTQILTITRTSGAGDGSSSTTLNTPADYTLAGATLTIPGGGTGQLTYTYSTSTPKVRIKKFLGTASQAASSDLVSESGGKWTSAHQLKGICYLYVRLEYDQNVFGQSGLPNISVILRGKKVYDPQQDTTAGGSGAQRIATPSTWAWSENAACCTSDYLRDVGYGMGASTAQTPVAELLTAAAICDQAVLIYNTGTVTVTSGSAAVVGVGTSWVARVRPGMNFVGPNAVKMTVLSVTDNTHLTLTANYGGSTLAGQAYAINEARYTANGVLDSADAARNNLDKLVEAMAGTVVWVQGRWLLRAGAHIAATQTITEDWLGDKAPQISPRAPRQELFNRVLATYAEREKLYTDVQAPPVANATYLADDGALDLPVEVTYDLCTGGVRAQRLAKIHLERARQALTVQLSCNLLAYDFSPSDVVAVTLARYGWSAKLFEVVKRTLDLGTMQVELLLRETASPVWDWALGAETAVDLTPNTTLPDPFTAPAALAGLSVTSGTAQLLKLGDGSVITQGLVAWTATSEVYVANGGRIEVRYKRDDATTFTAAPSVPGDSTSTLIGPLDDLHVILVQIRPVNSRGRMGAWTSVVHLVTGKTVPPADVAGLTATAIAGAIRISWTPCTDTDYATTELRLGASWGAGVRVDTGGAGSTEVAGSTYDWSWPAPASYTILARHRDSSGNLSTSTASVGITVTATGIAITSTGLSVLLGGGNLLPNSGFEVDSNADGVADNLAAFSTGSTGAITYTTPTGGLGGSRYQNISAATLGTTTGDKAGFQADLLDISQLVGSTMTLSAWYTASAQLDIKMEIDWLTAANALITSTILTFANPTAQPLQRVVGQGIVPATCAKVRIYVWMQPQAGRSASLAALAVDAWQFEIGDVATAYAPKADELTVGRVGTVEIAANAATVVAAGASTSGASLGGGGGSVAQVRCSIAVANTLAVAIPIQLQAATMELGFSWNTSTPSVARMSYRYSSTSLGTVTRRMIDWTALLPVGGSLPGIAATEQVTLAAGETLTLEMLFELTHTAACSLSTTGVYTMLSLIKR